jgi:hypothetical protein
MPRGVWPRGTGDRSLTTARRQRTDHHRRADSRAGLARLIWLGDVLQALLELPPTLLVSDQLADDAVWPQGARLGFGSQWRENHTLSVNPGPSSANLRSVLKRAEALAAERARPNHSEWHIGTAVAEEWNKYLVAMDINTGRLLQNMKAPTPTPPPQPARS